MKFFIALGLASMMAGSALAIAVPSPDDIPIDSTPSLPREMTHDEGELEKRKVNNSTDGFRRVLNTDCVLRLAVASAPRSAVTAPGQSVFARAQLNKLGVHVPANRPNNHVARFSRDFGMEFGMAARENGRFRRGCFCPNCSLIPHLYTRFLLWNHLCCHWD